MAQRSFTLRMEEGSVYVKHRVPVVLATTVGLGVTLLGLLFLPGALHMLAKARATGDFFLGFEATLELCIPLFGILIWLRMLRAGEILECDATELHHARQRMGGGWQRRRFPVAEIQAFKTERRAGSRTSSYLLLTFQCKAEKVDTLMGISPTDADRILRACQAMGLDVNQSSQ